MQLKKLARGLLDHTVMLRECLAKGGGRPDLKLMYEVTRVFKQKAVIRNEVMIHFGFPKLTVNNHKPYKDDKWKEMKNKHNLDKMIFSILDVEFNYYFYNKKMRLNLSDEAPLVGFKGEL